MKEYIGLFIIEQILYSVLAVLAYEISGGNTISSALDKSIYLSVYYSICIYLLTLERNYFFKDKINFVLSNITLLCMELISVASLSRSSEIHYYVSVILIISHYINEFYLMIDKALIGGFYNYMIVLCQFIVFVLTIIINTCYTSCDDYTFRMISEYIMYNLVIFTGIFRINYGDPNLN